jgi:hypothetical protein
MSQVAIEELLEQLWSPEEQPAPALLSFPEIGYGYRTGRSFGLSVVLHQLVLLLIIFSSRIAFVRSVESVPPALDKAIPLDKGIFLPTLGGGSEGAGAHGGGAGREEKLSSGIRARGRRGFAYPGPQPMLSDPPQATIGIQTILQPELKSPPLLRRYVPLPNMAQMAAAVAPPPAQPVLKISAGDLALHPSAAPIPAPKMKLPVGAVSQPSALNASNPIIPRLDPVKPAVPAPAEISDVPVDRKSQAGILVVNAIPAPPDVPKDIPQAEARSLFAVTPGEATIIAEPGAGSKSGVLPSMAAGVGSPTDVASGDALAAAAAGGDSKNLTGSGSGKGGLYGSGKGRGLNETGEGTATGRGTASGTGSGSGVGTAVGSGKGAGSAAGAGGFPGMTITGGHYGNSGADGGGMHINVTAHRQTPYGMTVTSTASSGGGLADFGVFQNEKVYTVYLDMRANDEDPAPSWIFQYALLQPTGADRIHTTLTPPYVTLKDVPEFTAAQVTACGHQMIVASAVLNVEGRLEQISVKETPDTEMTATLTEALKNWTFQPAQIEGKPVALKVLLGVRLGVPSLKKKR